MAIVPCIYSDSKRLIIPILAIGRMQSFSSHAGIEQDGCASFIFFIYFCVNQTRSVKDFGNMLHGA